MQAFLHIHSFRIFYDRTLEEEALKLKQMTHLSFLKTFVKDKDAQKQKRLFVCAHYSKQLLPIISTNKSGFLKINAFLINSYYSHSSFIGFLSIK